MKLKTVMYKGKFYQPDYKDLPEAAQKRLGIKPTRKARNPKPKAKVTPDSKEK